MANNNRLWGIDQNPSPPLYEPEWWKEVKEKERHNMTRKHYHVIGQLEGLYMPDSNDVYCNYTSALEGIDFWREQTLDMIAQIEGPTGTYPHIVDHENDDGKVEAFDYNTSEYTTYQYYISECYEVECMEDIDA